MIPYSAEPEKPINQRQEEQKHPDDKPKKQVLFAAPGNGEMSQMQPQNTYTKYLEEEKQPDAKS